MRWRWIPNSQCACSLPSGRRTSLLERTPANCAALAAVVQLPLEAARLKAKATALEAAEAARGPMAAAQAMVAEAEEAYRATAAPEEQAAATYARARHEAGVR